MHGAPCWAPIFAVWLTVALMQGYIVGHGNPSSNPSAAPSAAATAGGTVDIQYDEYHPFLFVQHADRPHAEFATFDGAVDEFYSRIEGQRLAARTMERAQLVDRKLEKVRADHERRLADLREEQRLDAARGRLIEANLALVRCASLQRATRGGPIAGAHACPAVRTRRWSRRSLLYAVRWRTPWIGARSTPWLPRPRYAAIL